MADEVETTQTEIQIALMQKDIEAMKGSITRIESKLLGNGVPGLVSDMDKVKAQIGYNQQNSIREEINQIKNELKLLKWIGGIIFGWALIQLAQFFVDILTHAATIVKP